MLPRRTTLTLLTFLLIASMAYGQGSENKEETSIFDWFHAPDVVLEAELQSDFAALTGQKMTNDETPGVFTVTNSAGKTITLPVNLRARGRFRRRLCEFPPIKLDFAKESLIENGLSTFDEYKLVTHCFDNGIGKVYILKEYLTYRLFQQLTDNSFRVQLFKIKYLDNQGKRRAASYGFIIENVGELSKRLNADLIEDRYNIDPDSLLHPEVHLQDVFQYMICNTDWSTIMVRNMKLFWNKEKKAYFVVPYDFDFSGLVSTHYAVPNADIAQKNIRERHYMGIARSEEELKETLAWVQSQREAMFSYIKGFKLLPMEDRRDMISYLNSFYESLEDGSFKALLASRKD